MSWSIDTVSRNSSSAGPSYHGVVSVKGRERDALQVGYAERFYETAVFRDDRLEPPAIKPHEVHLVDSEDHVAYSQQRYQKCMAPCLHDYTLTGVDEDDGQIGSRTARNHVASVLFVSRSNGKRRRS